MTTVQDPAAGDTPELSAVYRERAQLLALLATHHPAAIYPAPDVTEPPGWTILRLRIDGRWLTWHVAPEDRELFARVRETDGTEPADEWDGHTTDEKYGHIADHVMISGDLVKAQTLRQAAISAAESAARDLALIPVKDLTDPANAYAVQMITSSLACADSATSALSAPTRYTGPTAELAEKISPNMLKLARSYAANSYRAALVHDADGCPHGSETTPKAQPGA